MKKNTRKVKRGVKMRECLERYETRRVGSERSTLYSKKVKQNRKIQYLGATALPLDFKTSYRKR